MSWRPYIKGFKAYLLLERSLADNTIEAYQRDLYKLDEFLQLREYKLGPAEIGTTQLSEFIFWLNELGLGARTQARVLSAIKTFFKYLLTEDIIVDDPTELLDGPRLSRKIPEVMSYDEIQAMLHSIDLSTDHGVRNRAMLETLYACGLRVSELTDLRLSNLFLDIGFIKVIGKGDKERIVPIGEEAAKHINLYIEGVRRRMTNIHKDFENYLFLNRRGKSLSRVMVFMIVKECAEAAGIQKNVSPHTFRHSFATHLIEGGADLKAVQDMLGHESIITTEIYTHLDTDYLRETVMQFHPRSRKRG
ncbi:site-specific tyrosine recombinase XerD [Flavilitoribacter nigricans]|uniref:Tyrosine recombinase XerC n=1 Tax=Flavilitoribacter nigricans (strain ATCC 23147 / DSM 23189 / NBRC 102662 / NCIMB 1420 / SS-2) TaxID=1122177 RepID=A0A2D0N8X0_FLAN2|nr:site-specific tyrosine recombinase XerD [Flavilitoribacter nigricans]PHN04961.1 tyrosine recombinase XerD [Flavilitoribacter nigricans DSM 23189 = NBRC 102662]